MIPPSSPRLRYRALAARDLDVFEALATGAHLRRFLVDGQVMSRAWCADALARGGLWLVSERDVPAGFAGFWGEPPELVYALRESHTGKGFASEAAAALVDFGRAHLGLGDIPASVDAPNVASVRVLEELGFEPAGEGAGASGARLHFRLRAGRPPRQLRTERLLLRDWRDDDLPAFAALNADPRVMELLLARLSREESDALADRLRAQLRADGYGAWAVEAPDHAPFLGFVGLARPTFESRFTPCVEIGWRLAADAWGRGYATEAARAALRAAFVHVGLGEVVALTTPANVRSSRVMEKLGMRRDPADDFDHPRVAEGHPLRRHVLYRLDRARWLAGTVR